MMDLGKVPRETMHHKKPKKNGTYHPRDAGGNMSGKAKSNAVTFFAGSAGQRPFTLFIARSPPVLEQMA